MDENDPRRTPDLQKHAPPDAPRICPACWSGDHELCSWLGGFECGCPCMGMAPVTDRMLLEMPWRAAEVEAEDDEW